MVTVLVTDPTSAAGPSPRTGTETKSGPCFLQMTLKTNYVSNSGAPKNIDTLMMQQILGRPQWSKRMTAVDLRALTPLVWEHVNPYGRYELNMESRLVLA